MQASHFVKNIDDYSEIFNIASSQGSSVAHGTRGHNGYDPQEMRANNFQKAGSFINIQPEQRAPFSDGHATDLKQKSAKHQHHYSQSMINQPSHSTLTAANNATKMFLTDQSQPDSRQQNVQLKNPVLYQKQ